jgi:hypothetical protein
MPMALTLIEAIAGREKAEAVGRDIGVTQWDARHDSGAFKFTRPFALTAIRNAAAFWRREQLGLELTPGVDEVSLALVADVWSRTYRSRAVTFARTDAPLRSRQGIAILPDRVAASWPADRLLPAIGDQPPAVAVVEARQIRDCLPSGEVLRGRAPRRSEANYTPIEEARRWPKSRRFACMPCECCTC